MGKTNLQASLQSKFSAWLGELNEVQKKIEKIERDKDDLERLEARKVKLGELIEHVKCIFEEVNPIWDPASVEPKRSNGYRLPFEIGTVSREAMAVLRETGTPSTSRALAEAVVKRVAPDNTEDDIVDRVRVAIDASFRKKMGKYLKAEGEYPIYWSIIPLK